MYEIIAGRTEQDKATLGLKGAFFIGKHYVTMGQNTSLANDVYVDANRSHVVFIVGKRGSGKSYTMGTMTESLDQLSPEARNNIAVIILDTMGIYWTMKYENQQDKELLKEWQLNPQQLPIRLFVPTGHYQSYTQEGIPADAPFSFNVNELTIGDWCNTFALSLTSPEGVLISRVLSQFTSSYTLNNILEQIRKDVRAEQKVKESVESLFLSAEQWGLFSDEGTTIKELSRPGTISVIDVSCYAAEHSSTSIRALVIGLLAQKLFDQRMRARKKEEYAHVHHTLENFKENTPLIWLFVDEAHEFLPKEGSTSATKPLLTLLREGRQPGISLVLASQQPGQIHTDVITQSDIVLAHRLTAKIDIDALGLLMQSYMRSNLDKEFAMLPRVTGAALLFDDTNERLYPVQIKPRTSWHGGSSPTALQDNSSSSFNF